MREERQENCIKYLLHEENVKPTALKHIYGTNEGLNPSPSCFILFVVCAAKLTTQVRRSPADADVVGVAGLGIGCHSRAEAQELPLKLTGAGLLHTGLVVGLWVHLGSTATHQRVRTRPRHCSVSECTYLFMFTGCQIYTISTLQSNCNHFTLVISHLCCHVRLF